LFHIHLEAVRGIKFQIDVFKNCRENERKEEGMRGNGKDISLSDPHLPSRD